MPVSPPVIKTTWVFIEFLLHVRIRNCPSYSPMGNAYYSCDSHSPFIERIIGVAASVESVKGGTIISIHRQPEPDALWQVGIREEIPSKGHQISIALFNGSLGSVRFKTSSRDNPSREYLSQSRGRNVPLAFGDQHVPFDTWFDDVQVSESKVVQLPCDIVKQRDRIAVRYPIPSSAGRDTHRDTVTAPHRNHCFNHLKQEAGSVFDRTTVHIGSLVDAILQKLIGQVAVTRVKLNAVKTRGLSAFGGFAIILDNAGDVSDFKRAVRRRLQPAVRRRVFYRWILPILRVDRRTDRGCAVGRVHMRGTPGMPELGEHVPALPMNGVRDSLPSRNLLVRIQAGGTEPSPSCDRNRSPFRNDEPTFGGPLRIVLEHQVTRNTPRLNGPRACKRSHHHAVLQLHGSDLNWGEQLICP